MCNTNGTRLNCQLQLQRRWHHQHKSMIEPREKTTLHRGALTEWQTTAKCLHVMLRMLLINKNLLTNFNQQQKQQVLLLSKLNIFRLTWFAGGWDWRGLWLLSALSGLIAHNKILKLLKNVLSSLCVRLNHILMVISFDILWHFDSWHLTLCWK